MENENINKENQKIALLECGLEYIQEAEQNAIEWQDKAEIAWDMVHGRDNYGNDDELQGDKNEGARFVRNNTKLRGTGGRTRIHMNRVGLAQQQLKARLKQSLMNFDKWLIVEAVEGLYSEYMTDLEAKRLVKYITRDSDLNVSLTDAFGIAAVENVLSIKLQTSIDKVTGPGGKTHSKLRTYVLPLNIFNYYEDATGGELYKIHKVVMDKHELLKMSSDNGKSKLAPFIKEEVVKLEGSSKDLNDTEIENNKGNDLETQKIGRRNAIVVHEIWGTVLDSNGNIMEWESDDGSKFPLENVRFAIANRKSIIMPPMKNPRFNGQAPFVSTQLMRTNLNKYGRAPLYAGVEMNRIENKLMSAITDAALKASYNVNVLKKHGLVNPAQANGGLKPNQTLIQNESLAPGEELLKTVRTGQVDQGAFQVLSEIQKSGAENMLSNELNQFSALPSKQVRATEVVQASNASGGLEEALSADVEDSLIEPLALQLFHEALQFSDEIDEEGLMYIFGNNEDRMKAFRSLSPSQRFKELAHCFRFHGKGIRGKNSNGRKAQALVNLFGMLASNPIIFDAFQRRGVDVVRMFDTIVSGFDLDLQEFINEEEADFAKLRQLIQEQAMANAAAQGDQVGQSGGTGATAPQGSGSPDTETGEGSGF